MKMRFLFIGVMVGLDCLDQRVQFNMGHLLLFFIYYEQGMTPDIFSVGCSKELPRVFCKWHASNIILLRGRSRWTDRSAFVVSLNYVCKYSLVVVAIGPIVHLTSFLLYGNTNRKIAFVVGSERFSSSVFDSTLTQETLN